MTPDEYEREHKAAVDERNWLKRELSLARAELDLTRAEVAALSAARTQDAARYVASAPDSIAVPHSSSSVLGYVGVSKSPDGRIYIDADPDSVAYPTLEALTDDLGAVTEPAAVVRIGPDGRIG